MSGRTYTVEQANALLPEITPLIERLRDAQRVMEERQEQVMEAIPGNGGGSHGNEYLAASGAADDALRRLQELDIVVRDPEAGLIDFPSERDGERVFLCWRLGEDRVGWWHPVDTGFAGRRPL